MRDFLGASEMSLNSLGVSKSRGALPHTCIVFKYETLKIFVRATYDRTPNAKSKALFLFVCTSERYSFSSLQNNDIFSRKCMRGEKNRVLKMEFGVLSATYGN